MRWQGMAHKYAAFPHQWQSGLRNSGVIFRPFWMWLSITNFVPLLHHKEKRYGEVPEEKGDETP